MASPSPSPLLASLRRAADAAWVASGGPLVDEATAAMAEAHSLQLCLLGLQHEISEITSSTGAAEPTPSCESVEAKAEAEAEAEAADAGDGPVASQLFEGHRNLDGGGFRTLQHAFATQEECAQVPCTRHAHTMRTPCTTLRLAVCEQVRAAATLGMVQSFRRGGQTTLSITPELRERLDGCGASSAVPCLEAVMERVRTAAQLALGGGVLYPCGSLLIRLAHPHAASLVAPWGGTVQVPPCECLRPLP